MKSSEWNQKLLTIHPTGCCTNSQSKINQNDTNKNFKLLFLFFLHLTHSTDERNKFLDVLISILHQIDVWTINYAWKLEMRLRPRENYENKYFRLDYFLSKFYLDVISRPLELQLFSKYICIYPKCGS